MSDEVKRDFRCPACGALFGKQNIDGTVLDIKSRDLFRVVRNGTVEGPCRRCGTQVTWESTSGNKRVR